MRGVWVVLVGLAALLVAGPVCADKPYPVEIWADAAYDAAGKLTSLEFPQKSDHPAAFLDNLRVRIPSQLETPYQQAGKPASFETGIRFQLTISPGANGGAVTVDAITLAPRVLRMTVAKLANDVSRSGDWEGEMTARCQVTVKGRCGLVEVVAANGLSPDVARDFAKGSLQGWRFKPQRVNGQPIESSIVVPLRQRKEGVARPEIRGYQY